MLVVKSVEVIETEHSYHEQKNIAYDIKYKAIAHYDDLKGNDFKITTEMIDGQRFHNAKGKEIIIGWSLDVQNSLGLPFEVFENMDGHTVYELTQTIRELSDKNLQNVQKKLSLETELATMHTELATMHKVIKESTFWQRLKFLFTKKI